MFLTSWPVLYGAGFFFVLAFRGGNRSLCRKCSSIIRNESWIPGMQSLVCKSQSPVSTIQTMTCNQSAVSWMRNAGIRYSSFCVCKMKYHALRLPVCSTYQRTSELILQKINNFVTK